MKTLLILVVLAVFVALCGCTIRYRNHLIDLEVAVPGQAATNALAVPR